MPVLDGLAATEVISQLGVDTRVLILTTFDVDEYVYRALQAGASGFLLKDTRPTNLIQAIEIIAAGEASSRRSAMRHLIEAFARRPDDQTPPDLGALTERELDVLRPSPKAGRTGDRSIALRQSSHHQDAHQPPADEGSPLATGPNSSSSPTRQASSQPNRSRRSTWRPLGLGAIKGDHERSTFLQSRRVAVLLVLTAAACGDDDDDAADGTGAGTGTVATAGLTTERPRRPRPKPRQRRSPPRRLARRHRQRRRRPVSPSSSAC